MTTTTHKRFDLARSNWAKGSKTYRTRALGRSRLPVTPESLKWSWGEFVEAQYRRARP